MAALPYIQLYVSDYLSDTTHLSTVEHGAYLLLIMNYWQTAKALPALTERLAKIVHLQPEEFEKIKPVLSEFFIEKDGKWFHKRIEADLLHVELKSNKARANARAGAKRTVSERIAGAKQEPIQTQCYTDTDTDTDTDNKKINKKEKVPRSNNFLKFWNLYPVKTNGKEAQDIFSKKIKTDEMLENVLSALKAQIHEMEFSNQQNVFRAPFPAPHRWLNNERWNDDVNSDEKIKTMPKRHMSFKSPLTTSSIVQGGLDAGQQFYEEQMAREKQIANQNLMLENQK